MTVTFNNESESIHATIVGFDIDKDIAVLQLDNEELIQTKTRIRPLDIGKK